MIRSRRFHLLLGFGVSIALIVWICLGLDWKVVGVAIAQANYGYVVLITLIMIIHFVLRALRWRWLLADGSTVSVRSSFDAIVLSSFANYILPLRAGEIVRPYTLKRQSGIPFSAGLISVVLERFFDLAIVLACFAFVATFIESLPELAVKGAWALGVMALGIFGFIVVSGLLPKLLDKFVAFVLGVVPNLKLRGTLHEFCRNLTLGSQVLLKGTRMFWILFYSILIWATCFLQFYLYFSVFDLAATWQAAVTTGVIVALFVAAPSAPGFIGVYQAGCMAAFALFGFSPEQAMAYALVSHLHQYLFYIALGMLALYRNHLTFAQIQSVAVETAV